MYPLAYLHDQLWFSKNPRHFPKNLKNQIHDQIWTKYPHSKSKTLKWKERKEEGGNQIWSWIWSFSFFGNYLGIFLIVNLILDVNVGNLILLILSEFNFFHSTFICFKCERVRNNPLSFTVLYILWRLIITYRYENILPWKIYCLYTNLLIMKILHCYHDPLYGKSCHKQNFWNSKF